MPPAKAAWLDYGASWLASRRRGGQSHQGRLRSDAMKANAANPPLDELRVKLTEVRPEAL
jgi:hypothetical protein